MPRNNIFAQFSEELAKDKRDLAAILDDIKKLIANSEDYQNTCISDLPATVKTPFYHQLRLYFHKWIKECFTSPPLEDSIKWLWGEILVHTFDGYQFQGSLYNLESIKEKIKKYIQKKIPPGFDYISPIDTEYYYYSLLVWVNNNDGKDAELNAFLLSNLSKNKMYQLQQHLLSNPSFAKNYAKNFKKISMCFGGIGRNNSEIYPANYASYFNSIYWETSSLKLTNPKSSSLVLPKKTHPHANFGNFPSVEGFLDNPKKLGRSKAAIEAKIALVAKIKKKDEEETLTNFAFEYTMTDFLYKNREPLGLKSPIPEPKFYGIPPEQATPVMNKIAADIKHDPKGYLYIYTVEEGYLKYAQDITDDKEYIETVFNATHDWLVLLSLGYVLNQLIPLFHLIQDGAHRVDNGDYFIFRDLIGGGYPGAVRYWTNILYPNIRGSKGLADFGDGFFLDNIKEYPPSYEKIRKDSLYLKKEEEYKRFVFVNEIGKLLLSFELLTGYRALQQSKIATSEDAKKSHWKFAAELILGQAALLLAMSLGKPYAQMLDYLHIQVNVDFLAKQMQFWMDSTVYSKKIGYAFTGTNLSDKKKNEITEIFKGLYGDDLDLVIGDTKEYKHYYFNGVISHSENPEEPDLGYYAGGYPIAEGTKLRQVVVATLCATKGELTLCQDNAILQVPQFSVAAKSRPTLPPSPVESASLSLPCCFL